ncbi:MAG: hypothetical protein PHG02_06940 [Oscillospiraceae bacterium]|nr:hypothetical protein [Oscillospiraceae bacterium]
MKKLLALVLVLAMALTCFAACGSSEPEVDPALVNLPTLVDKFNEANTIYNEIADMANNSDLVNDPEVVEAFTPITEFMEGAKALIEAGEFEEGEVDTYIEELDTVIIPELEALKANLADVIAQMETSAPDSQGEGDVIAFPVEIVNNTGADLTKMYMTASNIEDWTEDLLNGQVLTDGSTAMLTLALDPSVLEWDLRVEDAEGSSIEFYAISFAECTTDGGSVVLEFDGTNATATVYSIGG